MPPVHVDPQSLDRYADRLDARQAQAAARDAHTRLLRAGDAATLTRRLVESGQMALALRGLEGLRASAQEQLESDAPLPLDVLERILGENDLVPVRYLYRGALTAAAIARVHLGASPIGTGWLIAAELLCTNHHVIGDAAEAARSSAEFDYEEGADGGLRDTTRVRLDPGRFFFTDAALDFTVVALKPGWAPRPPVVLGAGLVPDQPVNIVQHPAVRLKEVGLRASRVLDLPGDTFVHYNTDTEPGSSGSPVFNDAWSVVALHHSGVPRTNADGAWLSADGQVTHGLPGEPPVEWIANEGIRIDRILAAMAQAALSPEQRALWEDRPKDWPARLRWERPSPPAERPAVAATALSEPGAPADYYDAAEDRAVAAAYYGALPEGGSAEERFWAIAALLERSHRRQPRFDPCQQLYPRVDLQPDGLLRGLYTGAAYTPEQIIALDRITAALRRRRLAELAAEEGSTAELDGIDALLDRELNYNCESVVPGHTLGGAEAARGDLHLLFTCEAAAARFRGRLPYGAAGVEAPVGCGAARDGRFEPRHGKGKVARATLYLLLRYPGCLRAREAPERATLLDWARAEPPDLHERHRNAEIAKIQGNRNPLIDRPDWLGSLPLQLGLR